MFYCLTSQTGFFYDTHTEKWGGGLIFESLEARRKEKWQKEASV